MASATTGLRVPESELANLKVLAYAPTRTLEAIDDALKKTSPMLDVDALATSVAESTGLPASDVRPLVFTLCRLASIQRKLELSTKDFVGALTASLRETQSDRWSVEDSDNWAGREENIARLLGPGSAVTQAAKAAELLFEQQLVFLGSRVVTDLRPVFDEPGEQVLAFVVFHTLAITYYEAGDTRTIHIAMDADDVRRLREHLERAARKEKVIKQDLAGANLVFIDTGAESDE